MIRIGWGLGLALSLHLVACQRDEVVIHRSESSNPGFVQSNREATASEATPLTVTIEPGSPTVETDLVAVSNEAAVTYRWTRGGSEMGGEDRRILAKGMFVKGDEIAVVVAIDGRTASATTRVRNSPPKALAVKLDPPRDIFMGVDIRAVPEGSDADGDDIQWSYQWLINDQALPAETDQVLRGDRFRRGDRVTIRVIPSDAEDAGKAYTPLALTIPNAPPRFTTTPPAAFESAVYQYEAHANDADGDDVRYSVASAPGGMTIDPVTGRITWPLTAQPSGSYPVELVAEDGVGGRTSQQFSLTVNPPGGA
jgi:hypothetical protein